MMNTKLSLVLAAAAAFAAFSSAAMAFPERAVNYIIPFNPGGESDISARLQQPHFSAITGQDAVIQYQAGAGGAQAWSVLNEQPGDGHTIMGTNLPHIVLQPLLQDPGYETDDLVNVYMFHFTPDAVIVRADSEFETLQDLIDAAQESPGALTAGGGKEQPCGWLTDKFGVYWQVIPTILLRMEADPDREKANRVLQAMYKMKKIIIADLERAYRG
jgi:tripartite-type tricarboxylate transporter receptor subunit TctC